MMPYRMPARPSTSDADDRELQTFATRLRKIEVLPASRADRVRSAWTHGVRTAAFLFLTHTYVPLPMWWIPASAAFVSFVMLLVHLIALRKDDVTTASGPDPAPPS